ncbi:MAG: DUF3168 domain-containing protein [Pseudomonadota bacterium]
MTYALAWPLQQAVFQRLGADSGVAALLGDRIYDAPPQESTTEMHLTLGDDEATDWSTGTDQGCEHRLTLLIHAPARGFAEAKQAAAAVCDALLGAELTLTRGHVVCIGFLSAETARAQADRVRQIALRFRVLVEDTV